MMMKGLTSLPEKWKNAAGCLAAFLIPFCSIMIIRILMMNGGEISIDGFYHAGMGKLGPGVFTAKQFPWTDLAIWKTTFADKELLYHFILWLIFRFQEMLGFSTGVPFHFAASVFLALVCGAWVYALKAYKVPFSLMCAGGLLLPFSAPNWTYRLVMLRPHVLSLAFILFIIGFMARKMSFKWRCIVVGVTSFLYCWSYSNPHFIVLPVLFFSLFQFRNEGKKVLLLPLLSFVSVMLGLILHPQMPNTFKIWKLQSWDAMFAPMLASMQSARPSEMLPPGLIWLSTIVPLLLLGFYTLYLLIRRIERGGWKFVEPCVYALALLAFGFLGGTFLVMRSIEYGGPLTVLLFLILIWQAWRDGLPPLQGGGSVRRVMLPVLLVTILISVFSMVLAVVDGRKGVRYPPEKMAAWMKENLYKGEVVVNLDWSDFAQLFYASPDQYYLWGLDPVFAQYANPRKVKMLIYTRDPMRRPLHYAYIGKMFRSRYAVILYPRVPHASFLASAGWKLKKEFRRDDGRPEGWIFALDEREAIQLPHTQILMQK